MSPRAQHKANQLRVATLAIDGHHGALGSVICMISRWWIMQHDRRLHCRLGRGRAHIALIRRHVPSPSRGQIETSMGRFGLHRHLEQPVGRRHVCDERLEEEPLVISLWEEELLVRTDASDEQLGVLASLARLICGQGRAGSPLHAARSTPERVG